MVPIFYIGRRTDDLRTVPVHPLHHSRIAMAQLVGDSAGTLTAREREVLESIRRTQADNPDTVLMLVRDDV